MNTTLTTIIESAEKPATMCYAVMTVNETVVANTDAQKAIKRLETAFNLAECAELAKALAIDELRSMCIRKDITEFPNIVELCKTVFGISKAMTYNYLQVADWITYRYEKTETIDGETHIDTLTEKEYSELKPSEKAAYTKRYTDYFTNYNGKPFSVTALLAIIRFIKLDKNGDMDELSRARYNFVIQSVKDSKINGEKSVSEISNYLSGNMPKVTKTKAADNKPADNKPADNSKSNQLDKTQLVFDRSEIEEIEDTLMECLEMLNTKNVNKDEVFNKITACLAILKGIDFKNAVAAVEK